MKELIKKEHVYIYEGFSSEGLFEYVYTTLFKDNLVKEEFLEEIINREKKHPTGLDLSHMAGTLPGIAIPHADHEFSNVDQVIPIALKNKITFKSMIDPSKEVSIKFVFMILNSDADSQVKTLPEIMDFVRTKTPEKLNYFFNLSDTDKIYNFMVENSDDK